ncbi:MULTISPECIES: hypothetical protein [unclassified Burkholderia]|uniref:hypothetical protein n=1 Tax=unclassified Burkholderia TaxID=2613784 RepID=UPI0006916433|nr:MULTISPECIES: hypothetical protein [unclassified Burkholderia]NIE82356.1 hypothetical protein [Burkholderia sp. Tr-860]NIF61642.1 hypothetical protein [Burkholderia sp. Cy-647]NIF71149.1 hypothetical protein [Burkholderia sp. Ap-962]NIF96164.1 hypothetical protein [Burkholderia sp. Ax-1720]
MLKSDNGAAPDADFLARIEGLEEAVRRLDGSIEARIEDFIKHRRFIPSFEVLDTDPSRQFMASSTCTAADLLHPEYRRICANLGLQPRFHRKTWEWIYVVHKIDQAGMLAPGRRALSFGVGQERLPAYFASRGVAVVATDAPPEIGESAGWTTSAEHSSSLEQLRYPDVVANEVFDRLVTHQFCDMTAIDPALNGFDFTWSSCCFEHLGSLEAGMQFVIDSVEKSLKGGGVACHTTELNLSSNTETLSTGPTVIYRKRDMLELIERLRDLGHTVEPFVVAPDSHFLDFHVDMPPYASEPHLKLRLAQYVTTSCGLVVRKKDD